MRRGAGRIRARAVVGANFGDEGKGLAVSHFCESSGVQPLVVRHNGGAQAGHTVHRGGVRHVFGHIGSGALGPCATFLSRFFVCNPILFNREVAELARKGVDDPVVYVSKSCPITTPWDMMVNQIVEHSRGAARHGSCGVGFGETLERHARGLTLTVGDIGPTVDDFRARAEAIRHNVPGRLAELGVESITPEWAARIYDPTLIERWLDDVRLFWSRINTPGDEIITDFEEVIFEGAQGLGLDQDSAWFPHVTRSKTGLANVAALLADYPGAFEPLRATYVTRWYVTRHGAGPLPNEVDHVIGWPDPTNVINEFQGRLRHGWLDTFETCSAIATDAASVPIDVVQGLLVTCLDQSGGTCRFRHEGEWHSVPATSAATVIAEYMGGRFDEVLESWGPRPEDVMPTGMSAVA